MHKKNQYDEIKVCLHNLIFGSQTAEQSKAKISQFFFLNRYLKLLHSTLFDRVLCEWRSLFEISF